MNTKAKGSRRERQTIALLEKRGYACMKAGGSLGVFDVAAFGPADTLLVQVKSNRRPGRAEMERIRQFPVAPNVYKVLHVWRDGEGSPRVEYINQAGDEIGAGLTVEE